MAKAQNTPGAQVAIKTAKELSDKQPSNEKIVVIGRNSAIDSVADLETVKGTLKRITFEEYNQSKKDQKFYGAFVGFVEVADGSVKKAQLDQNDVVSIGSEVTIRKHIRVSDGKPYHSYSLA